MELIKKGLLLILMYSSTLFIAHAQVKNSEDAKDYDLNNVSRSENQSVPGGEFSNSSVSGRHYETVKDLTLGIQAYKRGSLWGLMSVEGKELTPPKYVTLEKINQYIKASIKGKVTGKEFFGIITTEDKILVPFVYTSISEGGDRLIAVHQNGKSLNYGLLSFANEELIPFRYFDIKKLSHTRFAVENYDNKIALYNDQGKALTDFSIDSISAFEGEYALFYSSAKVGLLDSQGGITLKAQYRSVQTKSGKVEYREFPQWQLYDGEREELAVLADDLEPVNEMVMLLKRNGKSQLIQNSGYQSTFFDYINIHHPNAWHVVQNGKHGLTDSTGYEVIPMYYDSLFLEEEFVYAYFDGEGSKKGWYVFDIYGTKRSKRVYEELKPYRHGLFPVKRKGKWGFMDRQGNEVIYCVYDHFTIFSRDLIVVDFHGEDGVIDRQGNWVVTPRQGSIEMVGRNYFLLKKTGETRFYSIDDELIYFTELPIKNVDGYLLEEIDTGLFWQIDYTGVRIQESTLDNIYPIYKDSVYVVNDRGRVGLRVRGNRDVFFSEDYEELYPPSEGFMKVKVSGNYGFVDFNGKLRIAYRYEDARNFKEGRAAIKILGRWGFIDKNENIVIQPLYDEVSDYIGGIAKVKKGDKYGLMNLDGELIEDVRFDSIEQLSTGRYLVVENGLAGLVDEYGEIVISPRYEDIKDTGSGELIVKRNGAYGIMNDQGLSILPPRYDLIKYDRFNKRYLLAVQPDTRVLE